MWSPSLWCFYFSTSACLREGYTRTYRRHSSPHVKMRWRYFLGKGNQILSGTVPVYLPWGPCNDILNPSKLRFLWPRTVTVRNPWVLIIPQAPLVSSFFVYEIITRSLIGFWLYLCVILVMVSNGPSNIKILTIDFLEENALQNEDR